MRIEHYNAAMRVLADQLHREGKEYISDVTEWKREHQCKICGTYGEVCEYHGSEDLIRTYYLNETLPWRGWYASVELNTGRLTDYSL